MLPTAVSIAPHSAPDVPPYHASKGAVRLMTKTDALIYFASGIVGSSLSLYFASQTTVAVGASGAIFGVTGALFVAIFQHRKRLPKSFSKQMITSLSFFITYSIIQSLTKTGIDNHAIDSDIEVCMPSTAATASIEPTERSIPAVRMTKVIPTAMIP